jgi:DNA repair protein RadA/Sms
LGKRLGDQDVFVNVVGGLRLAEPAVDLAIALAMASSYDAVPLPADLAILGEIGLSGELRSISHLERRLVEAAKLGFARAVVPEPSLTRGGLRLPSGELHVQGARTLREALELCSR